MKSLKIVMPLLIIALPASAQEVLELSAEQYCGDEFCMPLSISEVIVYSLHTLLLALIIVVPLPIIISGLVRKIKNKNDKQKKKKALDMIKNGFFILGALLVLYIIYILVINYFLKK